MPWYPSVQLYRQQGDDWIGIINEVADKLNEWIAERKFDKRLDIAVINALEKEKVKVEAA